MDQDSTARHIRSGGTRARLEELERLLHATEAERDTYRQTVVTLTGGQAPDPPPPEFVTAYETAAAGHGRRFQPVTLPDGHTAVLDRNTIVNSKRPAVAVWLDVLRHFAS